MPFILHTLFQGLESSQQQRDFWASFQFSAAALTQLYKTTIESVEVMQQQQNQQQQQLQKERAAVVAQAPTPAPPPPPIMQCSNCNQKLNWCQSCNTFNPPNALLGRTLPTQTPMMPPPSSESLSGKKTPTTPGSPMAAVSMSEGQTNRLKRTREAMAAAEDLFGEQMVFIKRFRKNHDPDDDIG